MKKFRVTVTSKPFLVSLKGRGPVDIHTLSDTEAQQLYDAGSRLVEPIPPPPPPEKTHKA